MFAEEDLKEAQSCPVLGPAYFDARRVVDRLIADFEVSGFSELIQKCADDFRSKLWDDVETYLKSDIEANLQGELWRMVDNCVQCLLTGDRWALERWAMTDRHDGEKVRAAVAHHIPVEMQDARMADLEKENSELKERLEWLRNR